MFPADNLRCKYKLKGLKQLVQNNDIVLLQETHFASRSVASVRRLCTSLGCVLFAFARGQAAGGVAAIAKRSSLEHNFSRVESTETIASRIGCLQCYGPNGNLQFFSTHMFPCTDADRIGAMRSIRSTLSPSAAHVIAGDFNFVEMPEDRLYYDVEGPSSDVDDRVAQYWLASFGDFVDMAQTTSMTYFGPDHSARLDRIYLSPTSVPDALFDVCSWIEHGFRDKSDHVPVTLRVSPKTNKKSNGCFVFYKTT